MGTRNWGQSIILPGCAHHGTQRGNRQATVFREKEDRLYYMKLLRDSALGQEAFILWLESELGRSIRPQKRGRKRKMKDNESDQRKLTLGE